MTASIILELNSVLMSLEDENEKTRKNNFSMKQSNKNLEQEVNKLSLTCAEEMTLIKNLNSEIAK